MGFFFPLLFKDSPANVIISTAGYYTLQSRMAVLGHKELGWKEYVKSQTNKQNQKTLGKTSKGTVV